MARLRVCVAGATGWAGSALSKAIFRSSDLELVAAISRSHAGKDLGVALELPELSVPVVATVAEALQAKPDVLVEYTRPDSAKDHILSALRAGAHVVVIDPRRTLTARSADEHIQPRPATDGALAAGANNVQSLQFRIRDERALRAEALRKAVEDARSQAETIAASLGLEVLRVLSAHAERSAPPVLYAERAMVAKDAAQQTPVEQGTIDLHATLVLTVEIGK